jgi:hypothetical protein
MGALENEVLSATRSALKFPLWLLQLATGAKSFADNPLIGSKRLNGLGLHVGRVRLAHAMADWRRRRLGKRIPAALQREFAEKGFVQIQNYLPEDEFASLRDAILGTMAPAREMVQGDTLTRRIAIDGDYMRAIPGLRALIGAEPWRSLMRYIASYDTEPLYYIQTIISHRFDAEPDPQTVLHADTFHPTMKAWYFLEDVAEDEGPFCYVPGSHRLTSQRIAWEKRRSLAAPDNVDMLSARGSMRVELEELTSLGLPQPQQFAVKANTLVVADTVGFHARGASVRPSRRVEIWAYSRRNPFYPWIGLDPLSVPRVAERRIGMIWAARSRMSRFFGPPWPSVGAKYPLDD